MPTKNDKRHLEIGGRHRALSRYYMILSRCKNFHLPKNANYSGIEVRVGKEDFMEWFMPRDFSGCSVDRIDPSGHYELPNMQVIGLAQNIAKDRLIARNGISRCWVCRKNKPLEEFVKDSRRKLTGRTTICKTCESIRTNMNYKKKAATSNSTGK